MSSVTLSRPASSATSSDTSLLTFEVLRGDAGLVHEIADEWEELCDRGVCTQPFFRPYFAAIFLEAFAPGAAVVIVTARLNERLVAVLPMVERTIGIGALGLRWLRATANTHFTHYDVVYADVEPDRLAEELWRFLRTKLAWDVIQIDSAAAGSVADRIRSLAIQYGAHGQMHRPETCPYVPLDSSNITIEQLVQGRSRNMRSKLRRAITRLNGYGAVTLTQVGPASMDMEIHQSLQELYRLEHASWKGEAGTSILSDKSTRRFYDRLVSEGIRRGDVSMYRLHAGGQLVAMELGLVAGTAYINLKVAYNEAFQHCSPGHMLLMHMQAELSRRGFDELDLGGTAEPHKLAWTDKGRDFGSVFLFQPGVRGHVAWHMLFKTGPPIVQRLGTGSISRTVRHIVR